MFRLVSVAMVPLCLACSGVGPGEVEPGSEFVHDPSRLVEVDGAWRSFGSGSSGDALRTYSVDLGSGEVAQADSMEADALADWWRDIQEWNPTGEFDAPSLSMDGERVYFTVFDEQDDGQIQDAIGVASRTAEGWAPGGIVLQSVGEAPTTPRAMDASVVGSALVFGSHAGGIYVVDLDPATGRLAAAPEETSTAVQPERFVRIADNPLDEDDELSGIEAPYIHERDGQFYLFVNFGRCCGGVDSTYTTRVGRSDALEGPYVDREGRPMLEGNGEPFLVPEGRYIGPGHIGIADIDGREVVSFHYYDGEDAGTSRLGVRELTWSDDGWPVAGDVLAD